ncbi:MAG TPA: MgtC/SapB family protein [Candidatus Lustribacter sp.]|jgi:putative Mg2+ transporter-C (MgtC) family protein|nr:MgtC/SapB family protein [Candidatus Lustribacter sp.]
MMHNGLAAVSTAEFALRVVVALVFGALIGGERQWRQRMAGLRTNALVCIGASLFVLMTPLVGGGANPLQIAAYIVPGIGFLAGGVIFKERLSVTGLNTAATLWCTAAVGALVGFGFIVQAAIGVAAVLSVHIIMRPIVQRINRQSGEGIEVVSSYELRAVCREEVEEQVRADMIAAIRQTEMTLTAVYSEELEDQARTEIVADVTLSGRADAKLEEVVSLLGVEPGVVAISWKIVPTTDEERSMIPD